MKSIFQYSIIILMNFTVFTPLQGSNQSRGQIIASQEAKPITKKLLQHVRTLSMRHMPLISQENDTIPEHHSDHEGSSNSEQLSNSEHSSNHEKLVLIRRLSQPMIQRPKPQKAVQSENRSEPFQSNMTSISRNHFASLEKTVSVLVISAGIYKLFRFIYPSESSQAQRSAIPTDMIGAAFWGANLLKNFASSGLSLVLVAYAGHKVKSTVDTLYENKFHTMLKPVVEDVERLAIYVDERTNPLAQAQTFLCDVTENIAQEMAHLADLQNRQGQITRILTSKYQKRHPKNPATEQMHTAIEEIVHEADEVAHHARAITQEIEEQRLQPPVVTVNPISTKEKSSKCCGIC